MNKAITLVLSIFRWAPPLHVALADDRFLSQVFVPSFLPSRVIIIVIPFGKGGGTDTLTVYFRGETDNQMEGDGQP